MPKLSLGLEVTDEGQETGTDKTKSQTLHEDPIK